MNREATKNERAGMAWWNSATEPQRAEMLDSLRASGREPSAAEAWRVFGRTDKHGASEGVRSREG